MTRKRVVGGGRGGGGGGGHRCKYAKHTYMKINKIV